MSIFLVTRPEHDDTTRYLSVWCKESIKLAEEKGFEVIDLHLEKANRKEIEGRLKKLNPAFVMLNGHGDEEIVTGHRNEPLIVLGENESLLKSKMIYALSCKSAKVLGLKSIDSGAISYSGFDDDFVFAFEPEKMSRILQDDTANLFLEPSSLFVQSVIKGNSIKESADKMKALMGKNFVNSLSGDSKDTDIARFLWWDLKHFVSHGDVNAKIC